VPEASATGTGPEPAVLPWRWSVLGPHGIANRWFSAGTSGHDGYGRTAGHGTCTLWTSERGPRRRRVRTPRLRSVRSGGRNDG
jgi:hypothetical protein